VADNTKKTKFDWSGVQNAAGASLLTGLVTPFVLSPLDIIEVSQNAKPLAHMPASASLGAMYKELFTNPKVLKSVYTKAVPARLIKNVPAQIATLGSFSVFKQLLDQYNPPVPRPVEKVAFLGAFRAVGGAMKAVGSAIGKTVKDPSFLSGFINKPGNSAARKLLKDGFGGDLKAMAKANPEMAAKIPKFLSAGTAAGIGTNFAIRGATSGSSDLGSGLKNVYKNVNNF